MNKKYLPSKKCIVCKRDFTWRKKWEKEKAAPFEQKKISIQKIQITQDAIKNDNVDT